MEVLISTAVLSLLFATPFKFFPDAPVKWSDVWVGALLTAVLFQVGARNRMVRRHTGAGIDIRRGRVGGGAPHLGVLHGADRPLRRRGHNRREHLADSRPAIGPRSAQWLLKADGPWFSPCF